jgi:hypothetical protein
MKRQPQDFTVGDRFAILDRAYKPTEIWLVTKVYDHAIVCHPASDVESARPVAEEHWQTLTLTARSLAVLDVELRPLLTVSPEDDLRLRGFLANVEHALIKQEIDAPIPYNAGESPYAN